MKLDQIFKSTGKPFFYYPGLIHNFGISVNACVFICFIGWQTYENEQDGWKSFNTETITKETGLSIKEQATARKQLVIKGLIEEQYARLDHVLKFRIKSVEVGESPFAEVANAPREHLPKEQMGNHLNGESSNNGRTRIDSDKKGQLPPEALTWNESCPGLAKVIAMSPSRTQKLSHRRSDVFWRENFSAACKRVAESDFCSGKNDRTWRATFEWMLQPDVVVKVMEGKYDNRGKKSVVPTTTDGTFDKKAFMQNDPFADLTPV